jgi:hypothetical protein
MSAATEAAAPAPEAQVEARVASPEPFAFAPPGDGRRSWLRAGVLFGGALAWSTAVFGAMAEHELWTGASAGFGLTLVLVSVYVLSIRAGYPSAFRAFGEHPTGWIVRQFFGRALATLVVGTVLWMIYVFITLVLCERSASGAMLVLGVLGMLVVFLVLGLFSRGRSIPRRDGAIRAVRALAWFTVLLVSVTALVPPLAEAMARRSRRGHDLPPTTGVSDVGDD